MWSRKTACANMREREKERERERGREQERARVRDGEREKVRRLSKFVWNKFVSDFAHFQNQDRQFPKYLVVLYIT